MQLSKAQTGGRSSHTSTAFSVSFKSCFTNEVLKTGGEIIDVHTFDSSNDHFSNLIIYNKKNALIDTNVTQTLKSAGMRTLLCEKWVEFKKVDGASVEGCQLCRA